MRSNDPEENLEELLQFLDSLGPNYRAVKRDPLPLIHKNSNEEKEKDFLIENFPTENIQKYEEGEMILQHIKDIAKSAEVFATFQNASPIPKERGRRGGGGNR